MSRTSRAPIPSPRIEMDVSEAYVLGPAKLALGDGSAVRGRIAVERGRIAGILPEDGPSDLVLPPEALVSPGLIDVHTNGADGLLFNRDQGNAVEVAARAYAQMGATGFVAAVMTAPWESMMHAGAEISEAANEMEEAGAQIGARCLGVHFEGPFLNPKFRRVHRGDWIVPATLERAHEMIEVCRGALVMVTMAPEVDGVDEVARLFYDQGIVCSAGHTSARYSDGMLAIGLGFRTLTHAFNAMPPLDHRDPSLLAAFMQEPRATVQAICDGYHVSPPMIDLLYRTLGDRLVLTTDNMPPSGSNYRIEGGVVRAEDGTIAGSALHIDQGVRNLMSYANIPFESALIHATRSPARLLGLDRDLGTLETGKRADLAIWDASFHPVATIVGGHVAFGSNRLLRQTRVQI
jgi:N-acetylglucosamine-6-phosphate deacetylase